MPISANVSLANMKSVSQSGLLKFAAERRQAMEAGEKAETQVWEDGRSGLKPFWRKPAKSGAGKMACTGSKGLVAG
jgi:hypothetical protein